jgi:hypothetical protein
MSNFFERILSTGIDVITISRAISFKSRLALCSFF